MAILYNNYCYSSSSEIINVIKLTPSNNINYLVDDVIVDTVNNEIDIEYLNPTNQDTFTQNLPLITCDYVGPYTNTTGLTLEESTELGWLVSSVLIIVYSITLLKRAL